jgi:hypothetical protein
MKSNRRNFIKIAAAGATLLAGNNARAQSTAIVSAEALDQAAARSVLRRALFRSPVTINSVELLRNDGSNPYGRVVNYQGLKMGMANTHCFSRCAQVMAARHSAGVWPSSGDRLFFTLPRLAGVT